MHCFAPITLGFIVDFISIPVTNAFTSATSLIITGAQLRHLLGIKYTANDFLSSVYKFFTNLGSTTFADGMLGITCCLFLLAFRVSLLLYYYVHAYIFF